MNAVKFFESLEETNETGRYSIVLDGKVIARTNDEEEARELCIGYAEIQKDLVWTVEEEDYTWVDKNPFYYVCHVMFMGYEYFYAGINSHGETYSHKNIYSMFNIDFEIDKNNETFWEDKDGNGVPFYLQYDHIYFFATDIIRRTKKAVYVKARRFDENGHLNFGEMWLPNGMVQDSTVDHRRDVEFYEETGY